MDNDFLQDPTMIQEFLVECEELLQGMDQDLVTLESTPNDADLLDRVFRALHTIKGTSGFLGFEPMVRLSHRTEDVLNELRRGEVHLTQRMMDAFLATRDQLGQMLADIRQGGLKGYDIDALVAELESLRKPVIMVSSLTHEGAETTLDALAIGTFDYLPKQGSLVSLDITKIRDELVAKVKAAAENGRRRSALRVARQLPLVAVPVKTVPRRAPHVPQASSPWARLRAGPRPCRRSCLFSLRIFR